MNRLSPDFGDNLPTGRAHAHFHSFPRPVYTDIGVCHIR